MSDAQIREWSAPAQRSVTAHDEHSDGLLIRGARLLDPASGLDAIGDLRLRGERIDAVQAGGGLDAQGLPTLDAGGRWLIPGLVDLCARFREPGLTHKASFASETRAAQAAGITEVVIPPDTAPVIDSTAMLLRMQRIAARHGGLSVQLLGALTRQLEGSTLAELSALRAGGVVGVSNARHPLSNASVARRALDYARGLQLTVHVIPEDPQLSAGGCAHEGPVGTRLGLPPIPAAAEIAALRFWISLVEDTGARVHFGRLSTARGVELIASAQRRGLPVTADVAAHQLFLTEADLEGFNAMCHVLPPARSSEDRTALRAGLRSGVLAAVCSDHQPHEADAKINPFPLTEPGISALETLLPLTLQWMHEDSVPPLDALARLSSGPAAIIGSDATGLNPGAPARLALIDSDAEWTLHAMHMNSAGRNTPFAGRKLRGRVLRTWHAGQAVFMAN